MPCAICKSFPVRTSQFDELANSIERHGTLLRCRACGTFFELIEDERSIRFTALEELKRIYPDAFLES
jgi:hypothetical protein